MTRRRLAMLIIAAALALAAALITVDERASADLDGVDITWEETQGRR